MDARMWQPSYVVTFKDFAGDEETRLIGHVEFLTGRPGALTVAFELRRTTKYGNLRCVFNKRRLLGKSGSMY